MPTEPVIVVHGGAWAIPDDMVEAHLNGVRNAMNAGWRVLNRGGSALDAVEEAIVIMEDDETFDAGRGSFLFNSMPSSWKAARFALEAWDASSTCAIPFEPRERS